MDLKVRITAYRGQLIVETINPKKIENGIVECDHNKIKRVLLDTGKRLGVSGDAIDVLMKIRPSEKDIGDIDCFVSGYEYVFAWPGGPLYIRNPLKIVGSKTWKPEKMDFIKIENKIPKKALKLIDKELGKE